MKAGTRSSKHRHEHQSDSSLRLNNRRSKKDIHAKEDEHHHEPVQTQTYFHKLVNLITQQSARVLQWGDSADAVNSNTVPTPTPTMVDKDVFADACPAVTSRSSQTIFISEERSDSRPQRRTPQLTMQLGLAEAGMDSVIDESRQHSVLAPATATAPNTGKTQTGLRNKVTEASVTFAKKMCQRLRKDSSLQRTLRYVNMFYTAVFTLLLAWILVLILNVFLVIAYERCSEIPICIPYFTDHFVRGVPGPNLGFMIGI